MSIYFINIPLLKDIYEDNSFFKSLLNNGSNTKNKKFKEEHRKGESIWELIMMKENFELFYFFVDKIYMSEIEYINDSSFFENFSIKFYSKKNSQSSDLLSQIHAHKKSTILEEESKISSLENELKSVFKEVKETKKRRKSFLMNKFNQ